MNFICDLEAPRAKSKARNEVFYLDRISELGREFYRLEAFSTAGEIRPNYPYQWLATTKTVPGEDDPCEGLGGTPIEALRNLHKCVKSCVNYVPDEDEEV